MIKPAITSWFYLDDKLKNINPNNLSPDKKIREAISFLFNTAPLPQDYIGEFGANAKLGVTALDYIADRLTCQSEMISLVDSIKLAYQ